MNLFKSFPVLVAAALATSSAAQASQDPFWFHCADVALLQAKEIQADIKLSTAQRDRMNTFAKRHQDRVVALGKEYEAKKKTQEDLGKDPRLVGYFLELKKNVMGQLSATQLKRLGQISLQRLGVASLMDDKVGAKVGLSKTQIANLRTAFQSGGKKYSTAEQAAVQPVINRYKDKKPKDQKAAEALQKQFQAEMQAAMKKAAPNLLKIKSATEKSMAAILSAKQKATYQALLGPAFKPK